MSCAKMPGEGNSTRHPKASSSPVAVEIFGSLPDNCPQTVCVLGAQWGDEGKGKFIDLVGATADFCCRFNGGHNAGHEVHVGGVQVSFHILPCALLHEHTQAVIGNGVVLSLSHLLKEARALCDALGRDLQSNEDAQPENADSPLLCGLTETQLQSLNDAELVAALRRPPFHVLKRLWISNRCHLLFELHRAADAVEEKQRSSGSGSSLGTTLRGIGPCYSTKAGRLGLRAGELAPLDAEEFPTGECASKSDPAFFQRLEKSYRTLAGELERRFGSLGVDFEKELLVLKAASCLLGKQIVDTGLLLKRELEAGKRILLEGANAALLDLEMGTYPFVTSSSCVAANACLGLGIPAKSLHSVVGIMKAYTTRVGKGPFPTEELGRVGATLQERGREFGVSTGRRRRCGWLDIPALLHAHRVNGFEAFCMTKLDVLTGLDSIRVCVAYKLKNKNQSELPRDFFPATVADFDFIEPEYIEMKGWKADVSECRKFEELPPEAQDYILTVQKYLGVSIKWVGVGADRDAILCVH